MAPKDTKQASSGPIFFWNPDHKWEAFLSQWWPSTFSDHETTYVSAEMYMMYQKAKVFGDDEVAGQISKTTSPKEHKALGRKVKNFDSKKWDQHKLEIVTEANYLKFGQNIKATDENKTNDGSSLYDALMATGDRELVEASPYDRIWGIGFNPKAAETAPREQWGENLLGIALMRVRERLRAEQKKS